MRRRLLTFVLALVCAAGMVAACGSGDGHSSGCRTLCTGTLDGARYSILVPRHWNGVLLVYSHGFTAGAAAMHPYLSQADPDGRGSDAVSRALLAKGYALAGSAFRAPGWVVTGSVGDDQRLYRRFVQLVGTPTRTLAWGSSLGGLITEQLDEQASWVDGAVSLCGAVAGTTRFTDALAAALSVLSGATGVEVSFSSSATDLAAAAGQIGSRLTGLAADPTGAGPARLLVAAEVLGLPLRSAAHPGTTLPDRVAAAADNLQVQLTLASAALSNLTRRYGAGFADVDLAAASGLSAAVTADLTELGVRPAAYRAALRDLPAVTAQAAPRASVAAEGNPTGRIRAPLLTLHDEDDPAAIAANETVLHERVAAAGATARLRQVAIAPASAGASPAYGVGHCAFSAQQQVGAVVAADRWARTGSAPSAAQLDTDLGPGIDHGYRFPGWPLS